MQEATKAAVVAGDEAEFKSILGAARQEVVKLTQEYVLAIEDNGGEICDTLLITAEMYEEMAKVYATERMNAGLAPIFTHRAKLLRDFATSTELRASYQDEANFYDDELEAVE